jgi:hypothetical protein
MNATKSHTATYKGRMVTVITTAGERVSGRFLERTKNKRLILMMGDGTKRAINRRDVRQFLSGQTTRGTT